MSHPRPPRLERIFSTYDPPLFFVTACTANRQRFLTRETVKKTIEAYAHRGLQFRCAVGRYVLMPDHLHLFVQLPGEVTLSRWMKGLKNRRSETRCAQKRRSLLPFGKRASSIT